MRPSTIAAIITLTITIILVAVVADLVLASDSQEPAVAVAALFFLAVIGGMLAFGLARWLNNQPGDDDADD